MKTYAQITLLLASLMFAAGCGLLGSKDESAKLPNDPEALALLKAALRGQDNIESAHISLKQHITAPGGAADVIQELDVTHGRGYSKVTGPAGSFELVFDGQTAFVRQSGGTWRTYRDAVGFDLEDLGLSQESLSEGLDVSRFFSGVAFLDGRSGESGLRIRATLDADAFIDEMLAKLEPSSLLAKGLRAATDMSGTAEYHLTQDNRVAEGLVVLHYRCNGKDFIVSTDMAFTRINEPITLPEDSPIRLPAN